MTVSTTPPNARAWVTVDLANIAANARTVQAAAGGAALLPVVKADAYGLGAVPIVRALEALDPWGYAVGTVAEGVELRVAGVRRPILVLTPAGADHLRVYEQHDLRAVVDRPEVAAIWTRPFHLEIDTGMARCGVRWDAEATVRACGSPCLEGVFTHLFAADEHPSSVGVQWSRFLAAVQHLPARPRLLHAANSAGVWRLQDRLDLVRPGIFLYGGRHAPDLAPPLPVVTVHARVVSMRTLRAGDTVSYGGEWSAPRDTTIATLGIGYEDGVPRAAHGRASVLLGGARCGVVGRVTMDFIMVDVGPDAGVRIGDVAILVGTDGNGTISIDEFAGWCGTVSYEVLTGLGARLPREYRGA